MIYYVYQSVSLLLFALLVSHDPSFCLGLCGSLFSFVCIFNRHFMSLIGLLKPLSSSIDYDFNYLLGHFASCEPLNSRIK